MYRTKGDNNNSADSDLVSYNQVQGILVYKIGKIGALITEFVTGAGIIIVLIIIVISYLHLSREDEKILAREYARRMYNVPKYEKEETV